MMEKKPATHEYLSAVGLLLLFIATTWRIYELNKQNKK